MKPAWNQSFDLDPTETMAAKKCLLEHAARERWWISFDHDHQVACGRLAASWERSGEIDDSRRWR